MSYKIGQFKRTQIGINNYESDILNMCSVKNNTIENTNGFEEGQTYRMKINLSLSGGGKVRVKLYNSDNDFQTVKIIKLDKYDGSKMINLTFLPLKNFQKLFLESVDGKSVSVNIFGAYKLTNILTNTSGINQQRIYKVGIQGPEGLIFTINGSQFQLGKGGVFTSEEMEITSLGFVINDKQKNTDAIGDVIEYEEGDPFFIVDYQY